VRRLSYHLVDVFTDRAFGGNQLAVFTNGRGVAGNVMQQIAKELNLSETTFVLPPENAETDFRLRIFTPAAELPFAGHPTVGTAFVLARENFIEPSNDQATVRFQEGVGPIAVTIDFDNREPSLVTMEQPLPEFGEEFAGREVIAEMLSIGTEGLDGRYPVQVVSSGVPFWYVPIKDMSTIRRVKLRADIWEKVLKDSRSPHVFMFTTETEAPGSTVHCRMFAPAFGIAEDPATGGASGPLGAYLVRYGIAKGGAGNKIISEQGFEMGRPSIIYITIEQSGDRFTSVKVGGKSVYMGEGFFQL
jgi:trans-2,3-dihydro-3-hydroxyanthranilate isomerase